MFMEPVPKSALIVSRHRLIAEMLTDYLVTRSDIRAEWVPDLDAITAPQRYGAAVIYDLELTRKVQQVHAEAGADEQAEVGGITIDTVGNN